MCAGFRLFDHTVEGDEMKWRERERRNEDNGSWFSAIKFMFRSFSSSSMYLNTYESVRKYD